MPNLKMACDFQSHSQFPRIARISCKFMERKSLKIFSIKWNRVADLGAPPPNCGSWVSVLLNSSLHVHIGEQMEGESKNIRCWVGFFPSILLWAHYLLEADCRGWTICIVKTCHSLHGCCGSGSYHHHRHHRRHHDGASPKSHTHKIPYMEFCVSIWDNVRHHCH